MSRRWMQAASIEIDDLTGAIAVAPRTPTALLGGAKVVAAADTPEPLVAAVTPCSHVWIGAPTDADGVATNTKVARIGGVGGQNIPILTSNIEGLVISIDDASKLYVQAGADGEGVAYCIFV